jgi:glycosyltransferase involved in cell wall biosynthesis
MRTAVARIRSSLLRPDIAIAHEFVRPPWGGSNQFLMALRGELRRRGYRVEPNAISRRTRGAILNAFVVEERLLRDLLHPGCRVLHRVDGPVALYRGFDDGADERIEAINAEFADATVFQSRYSLEAHRELGIHLRDPVVIPNAVDPGIFFRPAAREPLDGRRLRVVASSWSDNPNKGGSTYGWLDEHLDPGRYELTFVGRTQIDLARARVVPPVGQRELAEILRTQDVYVAASLNDPCSNALLEALACGLPALYARSGGHAELVGEAGLGFDNPQEIPALLDRVAASHDDYRGRIAIPSLADVADYYLEALGIP